jgi:hypothetical protein
MNISAGVVCRESASGGIAVWAFEVNIKLKIKILIIVIIINCNELKKLF